MAEMTVAEAIEELKPVWINHWSGPDTLEAVISVEQGKQIAALIEQQAAEIAELQTEIEYQNKQIARLQKDLSKWQVKDGQNDV